MRHVWAAVAVAGCLVAAACDGTDSESSDAATSATAANPGRATIAMITHEAPGDSFWALIRRGAQTAAEKDDVDLQYSSDIQGPNQAKLVTEAVERGVDGIAVTLARPDQMADAVSAAVAAGIPVVAFNSGIDDWRDQGAIAYFGQDEQLAGRAVGARLAEEGARKAICVIQDQGHVALESRCAGVRDGFVGGTVENVNVTGTDLPSVRAAIAAKLRADPQIDRVVTLGAPFALTAVDSVGDAQSAAAVVTFDTNAELVEAIRDGSVKWAVDQQPYLQGYLAVDSLWLYRDNASVVGGGQPTLTGPSFVDASNVDTIAGYAQAGTR
ncbi:MAG TPA: substrate-binding domain-containing protein [Aldersonia sp.]